MKQSLTLCISIAVFSLMFTAAQAAIIPSGRSVAPSGFEENKGQVLTTAGDAAPFVRYRLSEGNTSIFLLGNGIAYQFNRLHYPKGYEALQKDAHLDPTKLRELDALRKEVRLETYRMDVLLEGANADARITTDGRSADYTQYYGQHALDVHTYTRVTYHEVYPGIDWVIYTTEKGLEYDFVVRPGADPGLIQLHFKDYADLRVDADGKLIHGNRMGRFTEEPPMSFQNGKKIDSRFVLDGDRLSFALSAYDHSQPLTIDPDRIWSTYCGGTSYDEAFSCTAGDSSLYLAGVTQSSSAIASGGYQNAYGVGYTHAFLVKFNTNGVRQWGTYYGATGICQGNACAVDGSGNVYLAGNTAYDTTMAYEGFQDTIGGNSDAFLVKFDASGARQWGTYYGGTDADDGLSIAVDDSGNVYLAGSTFSDSVISFGGHQNNRGGNDDAFLVKFNASGVRQWGTYYGGSNPDSGNSCSVDGSGNVYLAGNTGSGNAIANNGHQNTYGGGAFDAFLVKFNSNGARQWGTYCGGTGDDRGNACAVDGSGNVYLAGVASSHNAIASGGHQNTHGGGIDDGYLVKYNANGLRQWGTYYGGHGDESANACAVDGSGNVYLAGSTNSTDAISSVGSQNALAGDYDAFFVKFNAAGVRQWGNYFGGATVDWGYSCAVDGSGSVYLAGSTLSSYGIALGGYQNTNGGGYDAFLVKFDAGSVNGITSMQDHQQSLSLWPNPNVGDRFFLQMQETGPAEVQLFDALGQLQQTWQLRSTPGQASIEMTLGNDLAKGMYLVRCTVDGRSITAPLMIQ